MHQSTLCRIVNRTARIIAHHLPEYVRFPSSRRGMEETKKKFHAKAGFSECIGCIDGTMIPIKGVGGDRGEIFRNRKSRISLNVQVVAGPEYEFNDICAGWPGSAHDARIYDNSSLKLRQENGELRGILVGDAAYMQTEFLYTAIEDPQTEQEMEYNASLIVTRTTVECAFGIWKRRFHCLKQFRNDLKNSQVHVIACAVLHNIGIRFDSIFGDGFEWGSPFLYDKENDGEEGEGEAVEEEDDDRSHEEDDDDEDIEDSDIEEIDPEQILIGRAFRNAYINTYFPMRSVP